MWGTKGAAALPVAEAAPGNPMYNGGRMLTHTVMWTGAGFAAYGTASLLTSYADVMFQYNLGTFTGGPPAFFECPLLPVK